MDYKITEDKLKTFTVNLKSDLINELSSKGHVDTGSLIDSINVNFNSSTSSFSINTSALDYLKYLDNGVFLSSFLERKKNELVLLLQQSIKQDIINNLKQIK